jgi:hypothetical protein
MAAEMLGGTSALEAAPAEPVQPQVAQPPLDLNFVAQAVQGGGWAAWGESFENLDDLLAKIEARLEPGRRLGRLAIAAYSADHTSGFMAFDAGFTSRERIDGLNQTPIKPEVAAKLARLAPLLHEDGVVELRVAGIGQGEHGLKALRAAADVLGVPVRGPVGKSAELLPALGLIDRWLTAQPRARGGTTFESRWLERCGERTRPVEVAYVPLPGGEAPEKLPAAGAELSFATENATAWAPGAEVVSGISDLVDKAVRRSAGEPIRRLVVASMGSPLYDGFVAFDAAGGESIDGSIREQPEYPHLNVIYAHVRGELERLRPHLAPGAEIELRVARLGVGEAGRRALEKLSEALGGVTVRAPSGGAGELRAAGGLATRWRSYGADGLLEWRWAAEPSAGHQPLEAAAFAPIKGVMPPLGKRGESHPAPIATPSPGSSIPPGTDLSTLIVLCGGCGRLLDEPVATPTRARLPCPRCGSLARRREVAPAKPDKPTLRGRVRHLFSA